MDHIRILPPTRNQNQVAAYYSLADAFVICSSKENFPTTCIEAQCCGTPVVGFDAGGTRETSLYGSRFFGPYGDLDVLEANLREVLTIDHSGLAAKAYEEYSSEAMYRNYVRNEYDRDGRKDRILIIDVNCKHSSTGKIVYDLFQNLRAEGRNAAVCYGRGPQIQEDGIYKFGIDWETRIHALLARITGYNGCFSPLSTHRLIRYINKMQPELVHIHELHAYFVNLKPLLRHLKKNHIPIVWTHHCEYMYTGKCGYAYDCTRFQSGCGSCPSIGDYPKSLFFDQTAAMFRMKKDLQADMDIRIVTPSQWLADRVKSSFLGNKPINVIHNGINTEIFHPAETSDLRKALDIPETAKVVLALAPDIMLDRKGGKWVLSLAERLKNENIYFILVGDTSQKGTISP